MAVAFDAVSNASGDIAVGSTSLTWTHANAGDFLEATVCCTTDSATLSATYNGVAMTTDGTTLKKHYNNGTVGFVQRFYLANAPTGSHSVVITASISSTMVGASTSWSGVDTTTPVAHITSVAGNGTLGSLTVTSATGNAVSWGCGSGDFLSSANQTERWNRNGVPNGANQSAAGASTVAGSWAINEDDYALVGFDIVAIGGGATTAGSLVYNGYGTGSLVSGGFVL